ncbi:HPr kinase [Nakamurella multipartita]|uniref:HPr kinase n=1 Tax=Nakamurella multipartita (strain ATCC 700099 / DSM 44233 / CIP 104796 / JCM 9543 / NBRC 105858 / Y-104) TaxID=479431 RepID=C8X6N5_NAKMY|nr:HPr kinase [Nakamurella multipartita]ACV80783.1 HPr kinase [Nakamurella multipartita DSM 44233]
MTTYRMYGWAVDADFPLHLPTDSDKPNLRLRLEELASQSAELPPGKILLDYQARGRRWYSVGRLPDGELTMRVYGLCDIFVNAERNSIRIALLPDADLGMAQVMATGTIPALLLYLDDIPVMHSSAVTCADGRTIAFLGRSGQGKSTLAALMCQQGAELLTDDVLPVVCQRPVTVAVGSPEVRLREAARALAVGSFRTSADARLVVPLRSEHVTMSERRLDAIFIPLPNRESVLEVFRLSKPEAHVSLMRYPRLLGWQDPKVIRTMFGLASAVADTIPVFGAKVPWGPPFRNDIASTIADAAARPDEVRIFGS